jgi:hypothetical protein
LTCDKKRGKIQHENWRRRGTNPPARPETQREKNETDPDPARRQKKNEQHAQNVKIDFSFELKQIRTDLQRSLFFLPLLFIGIKIEFLTHYS